MKRLIIFLACVTLTSCFTFYPSDSSYNYKKRMGHIWYPIEQPPIENWTENTIDSLRHLSLELEKINKNK